MLQRHSGYLQFRCIKAKHTKSSKHLESVFENTPRFSFAEDNTIFLLKSSDIIVENNTSFNAAKNIFSMVKKSVKNEQ